MTWTKLSDDFTDDCWDLSDKAFRLHVEGLTFSNRKLLDLRIKKDDVRRFAMHPDAVDELLQTGWWVDEGDVYRIVHHADYQRPKEKVLAQQATNFRNGRKGGRPPGSREQFTATTGSSTDSRTGTGTERDRPGQDGLDNQPSTYRGAAAETESVPEYVRAWKANPPVKGRVA